MCDRLPPQRIDARNMASLGHMAARAQALADEERPGLAPLDGQGEGIEARLAEGAAAIRIEDWAEVRPEDRYVHGRHPPAWPDLPAPQEPAPTPDWARRLAAWLREAEHPESRIAGS